MRFSIDTSTIGAVELLAALARINVRDALEDPELRAELLRCVADPTAMKYVRDEEASPFHTDEWCTFRVLRERWQGQPIEADCEDFAAMAAASALLQGFKGSVAVCITQPAHVQIAHAYTRFDGKVWDQCIRHGMKPPRRPDFYDAGKHPCITLQPLPW